MKKKLFLMLLAVMLVCALLTVGVSAAGDVQDATSAVYIDESGIMEHCLCGNAYVANAAGEVRYRSDKLEDGCIGKCDGTMLQWSPTATIPTTAGNWYLTQSYTATAMTIIGNELNLDLNGKTVTMGQGGAARFLRVDKNVSITDTAGGGGFIKDAATTYTIWGTGVWVFGNATLDWYAGTIDGNNAACSAEAGAVLVGSGCTFNMYGGTIQNGKGTYGGNVKVQGIFNLHDGIISGGAGSNGGGNLYAVDGGVINMYGGTVTGGSGNGNWGGNVTLYNSAVMNMSGGQIVDGIAGGAANNAKANMMIRNATLNISGGYISGGIHSFIVAGTINASGSAKIYNENGGKQITLLDGSNIAMNVNVTGALSSDAKIMVEGGTEGTVAVSGSGYTLTDADAAAIQPAIPGYVLKLQDNKLVCTKAAEESYRTCGGKAVGVGDHVCQDVTWQPWTSTTSLPSATGNYYLTAPVYCTQAQATAEGAQVSIDLRGYKVNFAMESALRCYHIKAGSVLNITDTVGGGALVKDNTKSYTAWGSFLWVYGPSDSNANGATLNLYAGTLDGNNATTSNHSGVMLVSKGGTFNMYGGTVKDGKAIGGGNITLEGAMNLYAGTVTAGVAIDGSAGKEGGNIWIKETGKLNMSGGKITYGIAHNNWGGNILLQGEMTMSGGEIYGGNENADGEGANVVLHGSGKLTMSGGHIHGRLRQFNSANTVLNVSGSAKIYNEAGGNQILWYWDDSKQLKINVVGAFNEDAKLVLNGEEGTVLPVADAKAEYAPYFCGNDLVSVYADGKLSLQKKGTIIQCVCGGKAVGVGDHVCQNVTWVPWANTTYLPSATGNYYLTAPVNCTTAQATAEGAKVNIDLRGYKVNFAMESDPRCYHIKSGSVLNITDSVGGGTLVKDNTKSYTAWGSFLWVYGPSDNYANGATLNLYAGTLDGNNATTSNHSGVLLVGNGGTFNMYGGTVKDGRATTGGNITLEGTMNLYAGTVTGGAVTANQGGNIYVMPTGKLNMSGGEITNGFGHNNWGGNVLVQGEMTMSGGEIYGGNENADGPGANLVLHGSGKLDMSGGHIHGRLRQFNSENTVLNVSGSAKIYNEAGGNQIDWNFDGKLLTINVVGQFNEDAKIAMNGLAGTVLPVANAKAEYAPYFCGNDMEVVYKNGNLVLNKEGVIVQCVCGGKAVGVGNHVCKEVEFIAWDSDSALPDPDDTSATSYYYYLTKDVVCTGNQTVYGYINIAIDLNGHTVTCSNVNAEDHIYYWDGHGTLSITDSVGGGKVMLAAGAGSMQGKMFWIRQGTFNLYGGTLDGNNVTMTADGAVVQVSKDQYAGVFNMYGGIIENGSARNGGNVKITEGTMNLYGGIIRNGVAQPTEQEGLVRDGRGDNIYVNSGCRLNVYGGEISGCEDSIYVMNGGVLAINGKAAIDNIYLADGTMELGENFACDNAIELNILAGGKIADAAKDYTASFMVDDTYELFYDGNGQIWYGGKIAVVDAFGNRTFYTDLQAAVDAASGKECYVKLLADQTGDITVTGNVYLDLNGFTLTGNVSGEGVLYCMDSATNDYNCEDMGRITGTVSCQLSAHFEAFGKRYMVIADETGYTAHRFYLGVTKISLKPAHTGVGYKAVFYGDEMVQQLVASYGYTLQLGSNRAITRTKNGSFVSGKDVTLRINNYDIENFAQMDLTAYVMITLTDGTVIESGSVTRTFRQIMESVDAIFNDFDDEKKQAVAELYNAHAAAMEGWAVANIQAYVQENATVELTDMSIAYEGIGDTTIKQLKNISAQIETETKKKITCAEGAQAENTIYVGLDEDLAEGTFCVSVNQTGISIIGADQKAVYYGVVYLRDSIMNAPSAVLAEGSWKVCQLDVTAKAPESDLAALASGGKPVNVLWEKVTTLSNIDDKTLVYASTQGGCYDGERYAYQAYVNMEGAGYIIKYDTQDNWKIVTYKNYDMIGHANDMAYKDGKIYVTQVDEANRNKVAVINAADMSWEGILTLQGGAVDRTTGIAYNASYDTFVTYGIKDGMTVHNGDLQYVRMMDTAGSDLTGQGICCDDNYIYQILWDEANRAEVSDAVMVYDWQGNLVANAQLWLEFEQGDTTESDNIATYEHMIESKTIYFVDGELHAVLQDWENGVFVVKLQFVKG